MSDNLAPIVKINVRNHDEVNQPYPQEKKSGSILAPWIEKLSPKEQRELIGIFRGVDHKDYEETKLLTQCIRRECQYSGDEGGDHYFGLKDPKLPNMKKVSKELTHASVHYWQHLMEALFIIQRYRKNDTLRDAYIHLVNKFITPCLGGEEKDGY